MKKSGVKDIYRSHRNLNVLWSNTQSPELKNNRVLKIKNKQQFAKIQNIAKNNQKSKTKSLIKLKINKINSHKEDFKKT